MARKLRSLSFSLSQRREESLTSSSRGRVLKGVSVGNEDPTVEAKFFGSAKLRNVVWLEIEKGMLDSNKEVLSRSLERRWEDFPISSYTSFLLSVGLNPVGC